MSSNNHKRKSQKKKPDNGRGSSVPADPPTTDATTVGSGGWRGWVPWIVLGFFGLMVLWALRPAKAKSEYDYVAFGKLPILQDGRIKPLDSVGRNALLVISGQQWIPIEGNGPKGSWGDLIELHKNHGGKGLYFRKFYQFSKHPKKLHPTEWLMEVLMKPEIADQRFIFRIDHPRLLEELKLENYGVDRSGLRFYSLNQLRSHVLRLDEQTRRIGAIEDKLRTPYQRAVHKLGSAVHKYIQLRYSLQPNPLLLVRDKPLEPMKPGDEKNPFFEELQRVYKKRSDEHDDQVKRWQQGMDTERGTAGFGFVATRNFSAEISELNKANSLLNTILPETNEAQTLHQLLDSFAREAVRHVTDGMEPGRRDIFEQPLKYAAAEYTSTLKQVSEHLVEDLVAGQERYNETVAQLDVQLQSEEDPSRVRDLGQYRGRYDLWATLIRDFLSVYQAASSEDKLICVKYVLYRHWLYQTMGSRGELGIVPPNTPLADNEGWKKSGEVIRDNMESAQPMPVPVIHLAAISSAYVAGRPQEFNEAVGSYTQWLEKSGHAESLAKGSEEHFFNSFAPFDSSMRIYLVALLLSALSWLTLSRWLSTSAFYLVGLAFVVHTIGLIFRMHLEGRPPVTNLYSSAVFVGWGSVMLGWVLERIYRNGIGSFTSGAIGFATLIVAKHLAQEAGDTMKQLQAVLDTNFWLATHVTCITIGYAATFLAGFLGLVYVLRGSLTKSLETDTAKSLARMVYGIVCFATLFSFVGTVLGGIWADQSWGRFWGWDTKENGALQIVIWNALLLHAKWGGLVRERGLVNLAIFGNIVTAWSWFGTNMLGIGLHAYGFMDKAFETLKWFAVAQLLVMAVGCLPLQYWASGKNLVGKTGKAD